MEQWKDGFSGINYSNIPCVLHARDAAKRVIMSISCKNPRSLINLSLLRKIRGYI